MKTDFGMFFLVCMIILTVLTFLCLIRTVKGPRIADRIIGTNMMGTLTIGIIVLLAVYLGEPSVLDICIIYAVMSFVAVIVLTKIYIGIYNSKKYEKTHDKLSGDRAMENAAKAEEDGGEVL